MKDKEALQKQALKDIEACKTTTITEGGAKAKAKAKDKTSVEEKPKRKTKVKAAVNDKACAQAIRKKLKKDLERLTEEYNFDKEVYNEKKKEDILKCTQEAKRAYTKRVQEIPKPDLSDCAPILEELKTKLEELTNKANEKSNKLRINIVHL